MGDTSGRLPGGLLRARRKGVPAGAAAAETSCGGSSRSYTQNYLQSHSAALLRRNPERQRGRQVRPCARGRVCNGPDLTGAARLRATEEWGSSSARVQWDASWVRERRKPCHL